MAKKIENAPKAQAPETENKEVKQDFFSRYSKWIYGILIVIVVCVIIGLLWNRHAQKQKAEAAFQYGQQQENIMSGIAHPEYGQMAVSEADSLLLYNALEGDGDLAGLLQIADNYGSRAPKVINISIAACYLQLGEFENAIAYADKYESEDPLLSGRALKIKGDASMQLGNYAAARDAFVAAAGKVDEDIAADYLFNAALACEQLGDLEGALKHLTTIRDRYSNLRDERYPTAGAQAFNIGNVERQIARIETLLAK